MLKRLFLALAIEALLTGFVCGQAPRPIKILFLGDNGHHQPAERFRQLQPVLAARGIELTYTDQVTALNAKTLASYDGLLIYANTTRITPEQEQALLDFVEGGKGFIPLHCASYCFLNSPKYIDLVGAQFLRHTTGTFRTPSANPDHPIMKGFRGFESWDETYVHTKHNEKDRTVLEYRVEGEKKEPWTWVRTQGKGRVFYTAWGHDDRTWGNPGFHNLIERGIRWAIGGDPSVVAAFVDKPPMTVKRTDVKPFEYVEANVPFYPPSRQWGRTGEPFHQMQKPLDPAESMKHLVTPVDFEVQLFVSEPDLGGKPIALNWDERGRLWVAVTVDYPNNKQPEGQGHDRIVICEDTKGTGKADKFTVFADKLSIPTSLTFANGGVIVHQPPQTLFLRDTNGDDVADERRVLFTGWHTNDTHAGPSNLRRGLDNWIYGIVGYAGYDGTIGGERHSFAQGFYRFLPDGSKMEFLRNTNNNSWGVGFSEEGILFGSTANGNPSVHLPIPNRYYESVRGWSSSVLSGIAGNAPMEPITDKVRQVDYHGHFTAGAGHALYTARSYPREYWNRTAFVAEPTGHLLATFVLQPEGASFRSRNAWNLLASDDEWTSPIVGEVGPDGQVWVIDWYNYIVQHNPTPPGWKTGKGAAYETELRDKKHGRIYRLVYKGAKPQEAFTLKDASPEKLVATLKNDNMLWRLHAQRLLVERGQLDVLPQLIAAANDSKVDEIGLNAGVIHALWTIQGLKALDGSHPEATKSALAALTHPSAGVRQNALQVLPRDEAATTAILQAGLLKDTSAQVRLEALLVLSEMPPSQTAAEAILAVLADERTVQDRWLLDAATSAAARHDRAFLAAVIGQPPAGQTRERLTLLVERVAEHYARGFPEQTAGELVKELAGKPGPAAEAVLAGLNRGWPRGKPLTLSAGIETALADLFPKLSTRGRGQLVELAARWQSKVLEKHAAEIATTMLARMRDEKQSDAERIAAAVQLIDLRRNDAASVKQLLELITPRTSPELAQGWLEAVGRSDSVEAGRALVELLPSLTPRAKAAAARVLLGRQAWTEALLDAAGNGKFSLMDLSLDQRQSLLSHPRRTIAGQARRLLASGGALPNADRQKVVDQLMPLTQRTGDAVAGKLVFKNHCAKCHTHSGEGAKIGPDLTGMAVHPKAHLIVEILDPSRSVEGNYRQYVVTTKAGRILSGLLMSETKTSVELLDAEGKQHVIQRDDLDELQVSNKSLMPEGFEKQVSADDLVNLLEFLTQRGKYLPLPLGKAATVVSTRGMFYREEDRMERLVFEDWSPKTFQGIPFQLIDPRGDRVPNVVLLYGPEGRIPPRMPRSVLLPCNTAAKAIHLLSGIGGWAFPGGEKGSVSLIVRLHYDDGKTEDHELKNGLQFADYIRRVDVPDSQFAFNLRGRQVRYLTVQPGRKDKIKEIEFVKGPDSTAPLIVAVTLESLN
jgi:putative membrane-bound dehydrogenase-like protein